MLTIKIGFVMKKKHEIIKEDLLDKILSGYYEVGSLIPKEVDLTKEYNVSRPTVRRAIQTLVSEGYLERKQRIGTKVVRKKIYQEFTQSLSSFNTEMLEKGLTPSTKVISFTEVIPNEEVKTALNLEEEKVYRLVRLRFGDEDPVVIVTTYLPAALLPDLMEYDFEEVSLYALLEKKDFKVKTISRILEISYADTLTSELLNINENDALFYFKSIGRTDENIPVEYSLARYPSDINTFKFEITID